MDDFEGSESFTSFKELCGLTVGVNDVIDEISKLPLDGILGFLAGLSLEMIQADIDSFSPRLQGGYLQKALVDDFPRKIPDAYKMYSPGRVPITGGRNIFVHEQNMTWLCNAAILYSKENQTTPKITYGFECRLFRLLLIINDFLSVEKIGAPYDLNKRRIFALNWLRHGQFNRNFGESLEILAKLARQKILLLDILPNYYKEVEDAFYEATGYSFKAYFNSICLFVTHLYGGMNKGNHWLAKNTITSNVIKNKKDIEKVIANWARSPSQYREANNLWMESRKDRAKLPVYGFVPLRETPLIEGRPGELICPVAPLLFSKIEDGPFFILSDFLSGSELTRFHVAIGDAYEEYAHQLIERIAETDNCGVWNISSNPKSKKKGELADSYLQRNNIAIIFEHKGQRPGAEFLCGGQGDRVLGPREEILKRFDKGESIDYKEASKHDKGFITRGMWQQSKKGLSIVEWAENKFGNRPIRLFPVITLLSSLMVDTILRKAYLNPLIQKANLYADDFWEQPQWLNIADLESLTHMAKNGELDIETLFTEKASKSVNDRFDIFLSAKKTRYLYDKLYREAMELLDNSAEYFFDKKLKGKHAYLDA